MTWVAQFFGACAICCSLIIYSRKGRSKLLIFKCIQDVCWFTHYLILSAFSAAATSALCVSRSIAFYHTPSKNKKNQWLLVLYLVLYAASACLTWKNAFSLLPALSSSVSTVAFWMKEPRHTKMLAVVASCCSLCYNIAVAHSISVYVGVAMTVTTSLISVFTSSKGQCAQQSQTNG